MWENSSKYKFGKTVVHITRGKLSHPRRWYTEVHKDGAYFASYGTNARFKLWAVLETFYHHRGRRNSDD